MSESNGDPDLGSVLMNMNECVVQLREAASSHEQACQKLLQAMEGLPATGLCHSLHFGFAKLRRSVGILDKVMLMLGGNVMDYLNQIAVHLAKSHSPREDSDSQVPDASDPVVH